MTKKDTYIEEVGLFYEKYGLPKMAGRILGCLISSQSENNSFESLQEDLKASKGSISGNLNLLLKYSMIEKYMISGDRKSYYKIALKSLENILNEKVKSVNEFKTILENGLQLNSEITKREKLIAIIDYYEFLEQEIPLLKEKWEQRNAK